MEKDRLLAFQTHVLRWYHRHGRTELPWRNTTNPYKILVSELMLQQTQVERVIPKYQAFLNRFPTVASLAKSTLAEVLTLWQGLGYNRRAKFLWQAAQKVVDTRNGIFPTTRTELQKLPGIGPYTASAVSTFAFNAPETVIETNIRSVFIYHFFPEQRDISDDEITPLITQSLYSDNPRLWYAALMDYGASLKKLLPNPSRKSRHHTKQSRFEGSPRQVRGEIIRLLTQNTSLTKKQLREKSKGNKQYFEKALSDLVSEQLVVKKNISFSLA